MSEPSAPEQSFDHVVVGGGMAADAAVRAAVEVSPAASVAVVGMDPDPPVARPALSKKLWTDPDFDFEQVWLGTEADTGCTLLTGVEVVRIDRDAREVLTDDGTRIGYGTLLLATGGHVGTIDGLDGPRSIYFRTVADYRRLRAASGVGRHVAVVGGGYIGTELAAALVQQGTRVTLVQPQTSVNGDLLPAELAERVTRAFTEHGVELRTGRVDSGREDPTGVELQLPDGEVLRADAVAVGLGITPATGLAEDAGLEVADGVVVDELLRSSDPHVLAAGDVASYPDAILGRRRVEHVDNATAMGDRAGRNMAGEAEPYRHTPFYYSVLFGTRWEAVGTLDSSLSTVTDWSEDRERAVVYYLDDEQVVGVLLWDVPEQTDAARQVLADSRQGRLAPADLPGQIPCG